MSGTATMTRDEWLAERRGGIGGSDAAAVLGLSPWRTAVDVWLDKTGRSAPAEETEAMRLGNELEDFVARRYAAQTGRAVQRYNRMIHRGCLLGNFDRLVVPEGGKVASHHGEIRTDTVLECKTASRDWAEGVPLYYQTQVQHYMGLAPELRHADVAALFLVHKHFEVYRIERDDAVIAMMQARLTEWWARHVVGGEMPPPTSEADCRALWARSNPGKSVDATEAVADAVNRYRILKGEADEMKTALEGLKDEICAAMGDAETLLDALTGRPLVTWKSGSGYRRTDWEAVARELGATEEQIAAHTADVPGLRRFCVKAAKPAK